ncbi:MAG: tRNA adenosine(34) deaminase TadA [Synergistaceae bacterium]|jgi:tRNA(adenine34) deaminase|nr:tRNA adenosine(34) deaminase TadA [Synergistaceae bacterium]
MNVFSRDQNAVTADIFTRDLYYMKMALDEAESALLSGEIPVGAVMTLGERVVGRGANRRAADNMPFAHAEMRAISDAGRALSRWRFDECTLYVTLEPCAMCAGAVMETRIPRVVFGARDPRRGAAGSLYDMLRDPRIPHKCEVKGGIMAEESSVLLGKFFALRRDPARRKGLV